MLFQHQVDVMRQHEILEDSRLGPKLMTEPSSQISMVTLNQTYAEQGRFKKQKKQNKTKNNENKKGCFTMLAETASPEGKLEALHMINENYWGVHQALREMKRAFLELHPECLVVNVPGVNGAGQNAPGEDAPGGNAPGENPLGENAPGGNAPGENATRENAPESSQAMAQ